MKKKVNHFKGEFTSCFTQGNKALDNLLSHWKFDKKREKTAIWDAGDHTEQSLQSSSADSPGPPLLLS